MLGCTRVRSLVVIFNVLDWLPSASVLERVRCGGASSLTRRRDTS